jgi:hypothetical protein
VRVAMEGGCGRRRTFWYVVEQPRATPSTRGATESIGSKWRSLARFTTPVVRAVPLLCEIVTRHGAGGLVAQPLRQCLPLPPPRDGRPRRRVHSRRAGAPRGVIRATAGAPRKGATRAMTAASARLFFPANDSRPPRTASPLARGGAVGGARENREMARLSSDGARRGNIEGGIARREACVLTSIARELPSDSP